MSDSPTTTCATRSGAGFDSAANPAPHAREDGVLPRERGRAQLALVQAQAVNRGVAQRFGLGGEEEQVDQLQAVGAEDDLRAFAGREAQQRRELLEVAWVLEALRLFQQQHGGGWRLGRVRGRQALHDDGRVRRLRAAARRRHDVRAVRADKNLQTIGAVQRLWVKSLRIHTGCHADAQSAIVKLAKQFADFIGTGRAVESVDE